LTEPPLLEILVLIGGYEWTPAHGTLPGRIGWSGSLSLCPCMQMVALYDAVGIRAEGYRTHQCVGMAYGR
jgi:hypothetical protein